MSENESGAEVQEAPAEARRRHADPSLEITEADHRYYILDSPTISDIDYDTKMRELRALEEQYPDLRTPDRKSTRLNSSHLVISYAVFCLKKKKYITRAASSRTQS